MTAEAVEARVDRLTQALMYVAGELWVTRDRQAVLERLLADAGVTGPDMVDGYHPDEALAGALEKDREAFVSSILGYLAPKD